MNNNVCIVSRSMRELGIRVSDEDIREAFAQSGNDRLRAATFLIDKSLGVEQFPAVSMDNTAAKRGIMHTEAPSSTPGKKPRQDIAPEMVEASSLETDDRWASDDPLVKESLAREVFQCLETGDHEKDRVTHRINTTLEAMYALQLQLQSLDEEETNKFEGPSYRLVSTLFSLTKGVIATAAEMNECAARAAEKDNVPTAPAEQASISDPEKRLKHDFDTALEHVRRVFSPVLPSEIIDRIDKEMTEWRLRTNCIRGRLYSPGAQRHSRNLHAKHLRRLQEAELDEEDARQTFERFALTDSRNMAILNAERMLTRLETTFNEELRELCVTICDAHSLSFKASCEKRIREEEREKQGRIHDEDGALAYLRATHEKLKEYLRRKEDKLIARCEQVRAAMSEYEEDFGVDAPGVEKHTLSLIDELRRESDRVKKRRHAYIEEASKESPSLTPWKKPC